MGILDYDLVTQATDDKDAQKIADYLHSVECKLNHETSCFWYNYNWDNIGFEHGAYYKKALQLIEKHGLKKVLQVIEEHRHACNVLVIGRWPENTNGRR